MMKNKALNTDELSLCFSNIDVRFERDDWSLDVRFLENMQNKHYWRTLF